MAREEYTAYEKCAWCGSEVISNSHIFTSCTCINQFLTDWKVSSKLLIKPEEWINDNVERTDNEWVSKEIFMTMSNIESIHKEKI